VAVPARRRPTGSWRLPSNAAVRTAESGASPARTQDEALARPHSEDEDAAGGVPGRRGVRHVLLGSLPQALRSRLTRSTRSRGSNGLVT
jgi:hypothetical protein